MQWPIFCFFLIAIVCVAVGLYKSTFGRPVGPRQHCASCGWTKEKVQPCHLTTMIVPLCFDCSIKYDAPPVRTHSADAYRTAYVV